MQHADLRDLQRRQNAPPPVTGSDDEFVDDGYYSDTAYIIKWSVIGGLFLLVTVFVLVAYFHAVRRLKKGQKPLAYHRWLLSRRQRMQYDPTYQNQYTAYPIYPDQHNAYPMSGPAPPPPVYDPNSQHAPAYMPPEGASKANPDQADYAAIPPPGAPPPKDEEAPAYPAPVAGGAGK